MADGLNISSGIGQGEAQVFNNNNVINLYGQMLARQQAKRQQEQQMLANSLAQVKLDGLREPDRPEFFKAYNNIRDLAAQIPYEKDSFKRAEKKAQVDQGLLQLQDFATRSKNYGKQYSEFQNRLLDDRFRDQFHDNSINDVINSNKLPMTNAGFIKDFNTLQRQVDTDKIEKALGTIDSNLLKKTQWSNPVQRRSTQGNKTGVIVSNSREVSPVEQIAAYANVYDADPNFRKFLRDQYADLYDANDANTAKAMAIKDFADKRRATGTLSESSQPKFQADWQPDKFYEHYRYRQANPLKDNINDDGRDEFIQALANQDTNARAELVRAVNRAGGRYSPSKEGFTIKIPVTVKETNADGKVQNVMRDKTYTIPNDVSEGTLQTINGLLNETDLFTKRPLYKKKENQYGSGSKQQQPAKRSKKDDPLGLF